MVWRIGVDGRPSDCRFVRSIGDPALDRRICDLLVRRGMWTKAALDRTGQPVASWGARWMVVRY